MWWTTFFLIVLCALKAHAESDIIRRIAETVTRAEDSYALEVRVNKTFNDADITADPGVTIVVARSGTRFRIQGGTSKGNPLSVFVTDGALIWKYVPSWHQYLEESLTSKSGRNIMEDIRRIERRFWRRFQLLSKFRMTTIHEGAATVKTRDGKRTCEMVLIFPEEVHERTWEERLWVEAGAGIVRKSVFKRRINNEGRTRTEIETMLWEHVALTAPDDDAVFRFTPPKGARLVEILSPPPGPQPGN